MMDNATSARGGETKDEGTCTTEGGTPGWGRFEASRVRLDGLLAALLRLEEENGDLTVSTAHPAFVAIVDGLSALGMEERMRRRFYDQLGSLREFAGTYGDCRVPADHPTLGAWVRLQREHYALCRGRMPSPLTGERFAELREVPGFDELFEGTPPGQEPKDDAAGAGFWARKLLAAGLSSDASDLESSVASATAPPPQTPRRRPPSDSSSMDSSVVDPDSSVDDRRDALDGRGRPKAKAKGKRVTARRRRKMEKASESEAGAPDEKIRPKTSTNNEGRSVAKAAQAASSSNTIPSAKKLRDKEAVAAELRRKRAKGTSHRLAMKNSQRLKDSFSKSEDRPKDAAGPAAAGDRPGDAPPAADTFEEALSRVPVVAPRRRRKDNYISASAPITSARGGEVNPEVDRYERRLEKMMRKLSAEGRGGGTAAVEGTVEKPSIEGPAEAPRRKSMPETDGSGNKNGRRPGDRRLGQSMPAYASTGGSTFDDRLRRKLEGEGLGDIYRPGGDRSSAASSEAASVGDRGQSMPGTDGSGIRLSCTPPPRRDIPLGHARAA